MYSTWYIYCAYTSWNRISVTSPWYRWPSNTSHTLVRSILFMSNLSWHDLGTLAFKTWEFGRHFCGSGSTASCRCSMDVMVVSASRLRVLLWLYVIFEKRDSTNADVNGVKAHFLLTLMAFTRSHMGNLPWIHPGKVNSHFLHSRLIFALQPKSGLHFFITVSSGLRIYLFLPGILFSLLFLS